MKNNLGYVRDDSGIPKIVTAPASVFSKKTVYFMLLLPYVDNIVALSGSLLVINDAVIIHQAFFQIGQRRKFIVFY